MLRGCLLLLLVFGGVFAANLTLLRGSALPAPWVLAVVLALLATLWLGSLQGLWQARQAPSPADEVRELPTDGQSVRLTGTLQLDGPAVTAPFSGRPSAFLEYRAYTAARAVDAGMEERIGFRGFAAARVLLQVGTRRIPLDGLPRLSQVPEESLDRDDVRANAATHLATTRWEVDRGLVHANASALTALLAGAIPADRRRDIIDAVAFEYLSFERGKTTPAELAEALRRDPWVFAEQRVEPGAVVTVAGTWRTQPQRVDVGLSVAGADHAIHPGSAEQLAGRERRIAGAFAVVLGLLALGGHLLVHVRSGAALRALFDWARANAA